MKANEAPEKIYVQLPSRKWIGRTWDETPIKEGDNPNWKNAKNIEYTRTDAFIEKACEWIISNMDDYIHVEYDTTTWKPTNEAHIAHKKVIEDFKNAMKG